jgi:hypothetical protein
VAEVRTALPPGTPVEVWFQDEMRVGRKNKLTYRWARKGTRPRAVHDQRTQSTYVFGAVCPEHGTGAALVLPFCNTEAMQLHLEQGCLRRWPANKAVNSCPSQIVTAKRRRADALAGRVVDRIGDGRRCRRT